MQAGICHSHIEGPPGRGYLLAMSLSLRIRELRQERGWTVAHLAELVGVSTPHMSQVERGIKNLNNHLLVRTAEALGVEPDDLIAGEMRRDLGQLATALRDLDEEDRKRVEDFARALLASKQAATRNE